MVNIQTLRKKKRRRRRTTKHNGIPPALLHFVDFQLIIDTWIVKCNK